MSKKDDAWKAIFATRKIEQELRSNGIAYISATDIKRISGGGEARLLTKFDTRESRPELLKQHNCTILPVKNGMYAIAIGDGYHDLETNNKITRFSTDKINNLQTLPNDCDSESQTIDAALASGILADFIGENDLVQTIRGRLRSSSFQYIFEKKHIDVDGVQIEVDGGFERERVYVVEAKIGARDNFIIRQLFYPLKMWMATGVTKEIIPIFLTYSNRVFSLSQYKFDDLSDYNSISLVKCKNYIIEHLGIEPLLEVKKKFDTNYILQYTPVSPENLQAPFPQANDVRKVIDVIFAVSRGYTTRDSITDYYDFAERQANYYGDAAAYLGFLEFKSGNYQLTDLGSLFIKSNHDARNNTLIDAMLSSPIINQGAKIMETENHLPSIEVLTQLICRYRKELGETTCRRRASTILKWLEWLNDNKD